LLEYCSHRQGAHCPGIPVRAESPPPFVASDEDAPRERNGLRERAPSKPLAILAGLAVKNEEKGMDFKLTIFSDYI